MWTIERLQQYIDDSVEENLYLDYKASGALLATDGKKNEISKDISAFANSDGGIIIYGISEYQEDTKYLPEAIDPINREIFSKETLEQVINTRISPRIHGVIITPITIGAEADNRVVYAVEIPKGTTAHQASDKKYYRRYNFQSIPMDDWEIKDIINRQNKGLIEISFRPRFNVGAFGMYLQHSGVELPFDILATNVGNKVIKFFDCAITGNAVTADSIVPTPELEHNRFELIFSNEEEYKITLEDTTHIVNIQRMAIPTQMYRKIGEITFYSDFFINDLELRTESSLDDNRITTIMKGKQVYDGGA